MSTAVDDQSLPAASLFADVMGQADAVAQLRAAARRPVHAYLLVGHPGLGQRSLVRGFAAALLCPQGGCGHCEVCRRALVGVHPDVVEVERMGALVSVDDARRVVRLAQRRPLEGHRQVIVVSDIHLARLAAPVLLKTLEEPAGQTVFVLLADAVPAELATVASRCVRIELRSVPPAELREWLIGTGMDAELAQELAEAAGGSIDRARLLAEDAEFRREAPTVALGADPSRRHRGSSSIVGGRAVVLGRRSGGTVAGAPSRRDGGTRFRRRAAGGAFGSPAQGDRRPPAPRGASMADRRAPGRVRGARRRLPRPSDDAGCARRGPAGVVGKNRRAGAGPRRRHHRGRAISRRAHPQPERVAPPRSDARSPFGGGRIAERRPLLRPGPDGSQVV